MRTPLLILTFSTFFLTTCDSLHEGDRVLCAENTADFVTDFSVLINGKPWIGSNDRTIYARPYGTDSMSLSLGVGGTSGTAHQIEHIFFNSIPRQTGIYNLHASNGQSKLLISPIVYSLIDPVPPEWAYDLDPYEKAFISVNAHNFSRCTIHGFFEFTAIRRHLEVEVPHIVDTLRFTNGRFHTQVVAYDDL